MVKNLGEWVKKEMRGENDGRMRQESTESGRSLDIANPMCTFNGVDGDLMILNVVGKALDLEQKGNGRLGVISDGKVTGVFFRQCAGLED